MAKLVINNNRIDMNRQITSRHDTLQSKRGSSSGMPFIRISKKYAHEAEAATECALVFELRFDRFSASLNEQNRHTNEANNEMKNVISGD